MGAEPGDFLVAWNTDGKTILVRGIEARPLTLYSIDLASGRRERWKELWGKLGPRNAAAHAAEAVLEVAPA